MAAPNGNKYWTMRKSHGRRPAFESPEDLWDECVKYFEWVDSNPLIEVKPFAYQGEVTMAEVAKMRAMTVGGLCLFLGISQECWGDYRKKEGFSETATRVDEIIREQKFTGAAADLLNPSIIARDLGLKDEHSHEMSGKGGGPIETTDTSMMDVARRMAFILNSAVSSKGKTDADDKEG